MKKSAARLENHRQLVEETGGRTSYLSMEEFTESEHLFLGKMIFSAIGKNPDTDPLQTYGQVLASWGIMCPHPKSARRYHEDGKSTFWPWETKRFDCSVCGSDVLKEEVFASPVKKAAAGGNGA